MKAGAADDLRALCRQWEEDSGRAFSICIARRGVIVLHEGFGTRDGEPMTVQTRSRIASLTKLLHGTLTMMFVEAGLLELDVPIAEYLPELVGREMETPLTLRHLLTHTAGMWWHWGDHMHDLEQRAGEFSAHLEVGVRHDYNGMSLALATKILEQMTGESLPQLYRRYLFQPLGCLDTQATGSAGGGRTTAIDLTRLGQMLLNGGAYGDLRFLSEDTVSEMMPQRLTDLLGPKSCAAWGLGTIWYHHYLPSNGLSRRAFTHGSGTSTRLVVDPEHELVYAVTRHGDGPHFDKYEARLNRTITENLERD